jgi:hypothetical protein
MQQHEEVEYILTECFIALGQNLGDRQVTPEAAVFWRNRYHERFLATLSREHPRAWRDDRLNVLAKARSLGRKAAEFATLDDSMVVTENHARQASEANDCRPRSRYGMFSIWCLPPESVDDVPEPEVRPGWLGRILPAWVAR